MHDIKFPLLASELQVCSCV